MLDRSCEGFVYKFFITNMHLLTKHTHCMYTHTHCMLPVPPQEVLLLLSDFRQWVSVTHQAQLFVVTVRQGVVPRQSVTLQQRPLMLLIKRQYRWETGLCSINTPLCNVLQQKTKICVLIGHTQVVPSLFPNDFFLPVSRLMNMPQGETL